MIAHAVIGTDEREQIPDTTLLPFSAISFLGLYDASDEFMGHCTGSFVGPDAILTAAHCLYDVRAGTWTQSIRVVPGRDGSYQPFGDGWAADWWVPDQWTRLQKILRYSRPFSGYRLPGSGDIVYSFRPGSSMSTAVILEMDGFGPLCMDISPGIQAGVSSPLILGNSSGQNSFLEHMIIPFPLLDASEEWYARAFSPDTQRHIRDIRRYTAVALLTPTQPRDIGFEVKARAILADYRQVAEPVGKETLLKRGDILVRNLPAGEVPAPGCPVFVVRFLQEGVGGGVKGSQPVVRGFWLGEPNPVATEDLSAIPGNFRRVIIEGDDQYDRIVRHLALHARNRHTPLHVHGQDTRTIRSRR